MASKTEICNKALSHLGQSRPIADFDTGKGPVVETLQLFYDDALKDILREYAWPFANRMGALALVGESPNFEWGFAYRYPVEALDFHRILNGVSADGRHRIDWKISSDINGQLIYTSQREAQGEWTIFEENPDRYPPDFVIAFSFRLAALIAPGILGGDQGGLGSKAYQRSVIEVSKAKAKAANERQRPPSPVSDSISARDA